jgi:hypothetical protein
MKRRTRTTQRRSRKQASKPNQVLAHINAIKKLIAVDEAGIDNWGDDLAKEEANIVTEGTGMSLTEDEEQNEMAMDNWPTPASDGDAWAMNASQRKLVAKRLMKMAKALLRED